jgi:hypothetical protein
MFTLSYVNTSASLGELEMCGNTSPKGELIIKQPEVSEKDCARVIG